MYDNNNSMQMSFCTDIADDGKNVGDYLRSKGVSKRLIAKLKRTEDGITCNGVHIRTVDKIKSGDIITISMTDEKRLEPDSDGFAEIVYEDEYLVVFNKPVNMPVHPSIKHQGDTLGNYFAYRYSGLTFRPVNRLDRDTSGLCVVAKNAYIAKALQNTVSKIYYAVVCGKLSEQSGTIDAPVARRQESIIQREVRNDGQRAVTHYTIVKSNEKYSLVRIELETGRTHQIRVHFAYIGHPLAGDKLYGGDLSDIKVQALHCKEISFVHPVTNNEIYLDTELREDMKQLVR